jgi:hypothetical protein
METRAITPIDRLRAFDTEMRRRGYTWTFRLSAIATGSATMLAVLPIDHVQLVDLLDQIREARD